MPRNDNPFGRNAYNDGPGPEDLRRFYRQYGGMLRIALVLVVATVIALATMYTVKADEVAVVTTFGRYRKTQQSGLHFRIPLVDTVYKLQTKRQLKKEFGFRTDREDVQSEYLRGEGSKVESLMLTGDLNVAVVEWIVHYQISDPVQYLFRIRDAEDTLRDLSESTMREVVGDYSVTEVLTSGREEILQKAKVRLAELCRVYDTGLSIQRVELKDSAPPDPVKPSFNEVNQAEQERDRKQNEALAQYNMEIPKAKGQAAQVIEEARGYAVERVNRAQGDVARFVALQEEYRTYPKVTRTRLYLETMNEVIAGVEKKIVVDEDAKGLVPMLFPMGDGARGGVQ